MLVDVLGDEIEVVLDGKNRLWKFSIDHEAIQKTVLDLEIDQALQALASNAPNEDFEIWWKAILALKAAKGEKVLYFENPKRDQILCRCQGYSLSDLKDTLNQSGLSQKEFMVKTNVGMTCTSCRSQVDQFFGSLELRGHLILGKSYEAWEKIIMESMLGFRDYSGIHLEIKKIERLDFPQVELLLVDEVDDRTSAENLASNFLSGKLGMPISIKLTLLT